MIAYIEALLDYYRTLFTAETFAVTAAATLILALIFWKKRKGCSVQQYHVHIWKDLLMLAMCQVLGGVINDFYQRGQTFSMNTIVLFCLLFVLISISAAEIAVLPKILSLACCIFWVIGVCAVCGYREIVEAWMVYCALRFITYFSHAGVICDILLYFEQRKKFAGERAETEEGFREMALCRLSFQHLLVYLAAGVLFILPGNLNYVNAAAGYRYGDEILFLEDQIGRLTTWNSEQVSDTSEIIETNEPGQPETGSELVIRRTETLEALSGCTYPYDSGKLEYYGNQTLNSHGIRMNFVNEQEYSNALLAEIKEMTSNYAINPSYLFVQLMEYDSTKAVKFPIDPPAEFPEITLPDGQDMTESDYAEEITKTLAGKLSFSPEEIHVAMQDKCYYSYFAVCEENALYYVTLYLQFDVTGRLSGVDYTLLQFVDLSTEAETVICPDYSAELEAVFASAFGENMNANFRGYDTILEQNGDLVLLRRYNNSYS